jgi:hypothetical protein
LIGKRGSHIALTLVEKLEIRADADDLGGNRLGPKFSTIVGRNPTVRSSCPI